MPREARHCSEDGNEGRRLSDLLVVVGTSTFSSCGSRMLGRPDGWMDGRMDVERVAVRMYVCWATGAWLVLGRRV
jgi:hypothetical protein